MDIEQIRARLQELAEEHFPEKDFDASQIKIEISNRMRKTAAKVLAWRNGAKTLRLSKKHFDKFGWKGKEMDQVLKHELIHLLGIFSHDEAFEKIAKKIGAPRFCKSLTHDRPTEIIYECRACGFSFSSVNYVNFCPKCGDLVSEIGELEI